MAMAWTSATSLPGKLRRVVGKQTWGSWQPIVLLGLFLGLMELDLWFIRSTGSVLGRVVIYSLIAGLFWLYWKSHPQAHDRPGSTGRAWLRALAATAGMALLLLGTALLVSEPYEEWFKTMLRRPPGLLGSWLTHKLAGIVGQQVALQWFLWPVSRQVVASRPWALGLAVAVAGIIHLPSWPLVLITALASLAWIWLYEISGRLMPVIFSQIVLILLAHGVLPERLVYDMRVGSQATAMLQRNGATYQERVREKLRIYGVPKYYVRHGNTDQGFVVGMYQDVLGRTPETWEIEQWVENLQRMSPVEVAERFLTSAELAEKEAASR
jgi:hypothetical protein